MYQDDNDNIRMSEVFKGVRASGIEASQFMKTRVLAQLRQERQFKRKLFMWQFVTAGSLAALVATFFIGFKMISQIKADAFTREAYVIHVDFTQNDRQQVAAAEVELPQGVHFVSKSGVASLHKLRLPVDVKAAGRGKLPFVVSADDPGEKRIVVRLLNRDDQVIREQIFNYRFAKQDGNIL
jgi:hypothetical protein